MFADLHIHSIYSDGTDTPAELIKRAKNKYKDVDLWKLSLISILY